MFLFALICFLFMILVIYLEYVWTKKDRSLKEKISFLNSNNVVLEFNSRAFLDKNLLLEKFGISSKAIHKKPGNTERTTKVQVILPNLTKDGELYYEYDWIFITSVKIPQQQYKTDEEWAKLETAQKLTKPIIEHLQIKSELKELNEQYQELKELFNLVSTSDFYASQKSLYERGLLQVKELIAKAENLEKTYYNLIREVLIGRRLAKYDPSQIPDNHIVLDSQYQEIKEEYQYMKDTATAYNELLNNRQI